METSIWVQRARISNFAFKDLNTPYFHMLVKIRQSRRYPNMLKDDHGHRVKGHAEIAAIIPNYFTHFFGSVGRCDLHGLGPHPLHKFFTDITHLDIYAGGGPPGLICHEFF